jgi:two-component system response regulator AtoC
MPPAEMVFGRTPAMLAVRERLQKLASTNLPVLVQGESGTGKDVIARMIHLTSPWKGGPFLRVDCPAAPPTIFENGWFGGEHGARHALTREPRQRGTLFLDEVAELNSGLQSSLLHLLQEGQFARLGSSRRMEVRVVCASSRNLENRLSSGSFREDLFYRLNVVTLSLPPLRQRIPDIAPLAAFFIECFNRKYDCQARPLSAAALSLIQKYPWPGNIRELENVIKRYVILDSEEVITSALAKPQPLADDLSVGIDLEGPIALKQVTRRAVRQLERKIILKVLEANRWNRKRSARALGISYRALLYKIQDAGVPSNPRWQRQTPAPPTAD